jgi:ABC-type uncharacterized transport system involved in gliding motility auxiliary subunit
MNAKTGKRRLAILLALTSAVIVAGLLVVGRFTFRLDLSADQSQSLSKVSRNLYNEIPEHLHITYYLSPTLGDRHPGPRAVQDLLRELEASSRGKIDISIEDPSSRTGAVDALGVQGKQMQIVEKNEQRVAIVYSGIVVQYLERSEVIPFVLDGSTLEYDLVKAIRRAVQTGGQKLALLLGDADKSLANDYRTVNDALGKSGWQVSEVAKGDKVPPEAKVLLVLGNADLDDYDVYRIDEYLSRGGAALIAVKGVGIDAQQSLTASPLKQEALLRALSAWGIDVGRSLVLDPSSLTVPFQEAGDFGGSVIRYVQYPHWIITRPENALASNPVTARLAGLDLFWPSPLTLLSKPGVKEEILVKSTPKAWLQTSRFAVRPEESAGFRAEADKTSGQYGLAATLAGALPLAYPGPKLPERSGAIKLEPAQNPPSPSRILVVGSADFATDLMNMTNSQFNANFIASGVDWLATGDELASIRSRGGKDPRLTKIQDPGARQSAIFLAYGINIALVPGGLVLFGLLKRRKRRDLARSEALASQGPGGKAPEKAREEASK